jgi:hypothetical protein
MIVVEERQVCLIQPELPFPPIGLERQMAMSNCDVLPKFLELQYAKISWARPVIFPGNVPVKIVEIESNSRSLLDPTHFSPAHTFSHYKVLVSTPAHLASLPHPISLVSCTRRACTGFSNMPLIASICPSSTSCPFYEQPLGRVIYRV